MYTRFQLAKKYLWYQFTASNAKGHGVHSPYVFDFIKNILQDKDHYDCYSRIENIRKNLLNNNSAIEVEDFGAGSAVMKSNTRVIKNIAASSLKPKKFSQLLYRIVKYYQPATVLELGTSLGVTTVYLAEGNPAANIYTCEGAKNIAAIAHQNFAQLSIKNIELVEGDFAKTLQPLLNKIGKIDFAFIDGNHRRQPTINYFENLLRHSKPTTILIFDDIHWSKEMEEAWAIIQQHSSVTLTIDLFFIGLVFINPDFKVKQQYVIRY